MTAIRAHIHKQAKPRSKHTKAAAAASSTTDSTATNKDELTSTAETMAPTMSVAVPRKPHRFRPGTVALRQIRKMQKTTDDAKFIPRAAIYRLINEILQEEAPEMRMAPAAREALHSKVVDFIGELMEKTNHIMIQAYNGKRVTIQPRFLRLAKEMIAPDLERR